MDGRAFVGEPKGCRQFKVFGCIAQPSDYSIPDLRFDVLGDLNWSVELYGEFMLWKELYVGVYG